MAIPSCGTCYFFDPYHLPKNPWHRCQANVQNQFRKEDDVACLNHYVKIDTGKLERSYRESMGQKEYLFFDE